MTAERWSIDARRQNRSTQKEMARVSPWRIGPPAQ
jgi:hypothetical protein